MDQVNMIGIDLAKNTFQLHGARADGSVAFRKKLSGGKVLELLASCMSVLVLEIPELSPVVRIGVLG